MTEREGVFQAGDVEVFVSCARADERAKVLSEVVAALRDGPRNPTGTGPLHGPAADYIEQKFKEEK